MASQSSRRRSRPDSSPIRRSRWRNVFGWTYSASDVALIDAVPPQEFLERRDELCAAQDVVVGEPSDRVHGRVPNAAVDRDTQEVLVRAEVVVREDGRPAGEATVPISACWASANPSAYDAWPRQTLETPIAPARRARRGCA